MSYMKSLSLAGLVLLVFPCLAALASAAAFHWRRRSALTFLVLLSLANGAEAGFGVTYDGQLLAINPTTGVGTLIGATGFSGLRGLEMEVDGYLLATSDASGLFGSTP